MAKLSKSEIRKALLADQTLSADVKSQLLELLKTPTFGLVWEEKSEDTWENLKTKLPILTEEKDCAIISSNLAAPNHILVEADNLDALVALTYTDAKRFDVIYIDPPYNTGARDWKYNNDYVDSEDSYRHSKWLSLMNRRLRIAKKLLKPEEGVLIVAIDDYEVSHISVLLEQLFGTYNICPVIVNHHPQGGAADNISRTHEYALFIIPKGKKIIKGEREDSVEEEWSLMRSGTDIRNQRVGRPKSFYAIYVNQKTLQVVGVGPELGRDEIYNMEEAPSGCFAIFPVSGGVERVWRYTRESMREHIESGLVKCTANRSLKVIKRKDVKYKPVFSLWSGPQYNAGTNGTNLLYSIFGDTRFSYPKSLYTVYDALKCCLQEKKDAKILDFFAGSGTTMHATMMLNEEDGGHRTCTLITNNENNICRDVTYERNKRVILGYSTPKGDRVEGLTGNSLRYFKIAYVNREDSIAAKRKLMESSIDLLRIKENIYEEKDSFGSLKLRKSVARYFEDGEDRMLVIMNPDAIEYFVEEISGMDIQKPIKVYVFSMNDYAMDADFADVEEKVSLVALPSAISRAYRKVLPRKTQEPETEEPQDAENVLPFDED